MGGRLREPWVGGAAACGLHAPVVLPRRYARRRPFGGAAKGGLHAGCAGREGLHTKWIGGAA